MKFEHQISEEPITHKAWDRRTLLFLLYKAKFWAKIAQNEHYALIGGRDTIVSRVRIRPMGARQDLALYCKVQ